MEVMRQGSSQTEWCQPAVTVDRQTKIVLVHLICFSLGSVGDEHFTRRERSNDVVASLKKIFPPELCQSASDKDRSPPLGLFCE